MFYKISDYKFRLIEEILPEKDNSGRIKEFRPKDKYKNIKNLRLSKYGLGPFCSFKILKKHKNKTGVYLIVINNELKYVGICEDLYQRFNSGYGNISPRNCYLKGQSTNCKINLKILKEAEKSNRINLYFLETKDVHNIEEMIIDNYKPEWNSKKASNYNLNNSTERGVPKMNNKYDNLKEYLNNYTLTLSYDEIIKIIGEDLPKSAYNHRAWWANTGHEHAKTWTDGGWKVEAVKLGESITFKKK